MNSINDESFYGIVKIENNSAARTYRLSIQSDYSSFLIAWKLKWVRISQIEICFVTNLADFSICYCTAESLEILIQ